MRTNGILLTLLCLLAGCAQNAPHTRPASLDSLTAQFKATAETNRLEVARKIATLMPACPVVNPNGLIGHWLSFGEDETIGPPSYSLTEGDLIAALGAPDSTHSFRVTSRWDFLSWRVGRDRQHDECRLYIHCCDGLVVSGMVLKTNTIQSIVIHTTLSKSVIVRTNYVE